MNINAISGYSSYNRINFGQRKVNKYNDNTDNKSDNFKNTDLQDHDDRIFLKGALAGIVASALVYQSMSDKAVKSSDDFYGRVNKIAQSDSIKQDTFSVTDYNKDKTPDIVLYKKDGSKVVVDMKNQKIINSKKKNDSIQKDSDARQNIFKSDGNNEKNIFLSY